jgi:hypothetical protein
MGRSISASLCTSKTEHQQFHRYFASPNKKKRLDPCQAHHWHKAALPQGLVVTQHGLVSCNETRADEIRKNFRQDIHTFLLYNTVECAMMDQMTRINKNKAVTKSELNSTKIK